MDTIKTYVDSSGDGGMSREDCARRLTQLVHPDIRRRYVASGRLDALMSADINTFNAQVEASVDAAAAILGCSVAHILQQFAHRMIADSKTASDLMSAALAPNTLQTTREDRVLDRITDRIRNSEEGPERDKETRRFARVSAFMLSRCCEDDDGDGNRHMTTSITLNVVLSALWSRFDSNDTQPVMEHLLRSTSHSHLANDVIDRLGPRGVRYLPTLLELFEDVSGPRSFAFDSTLAALAKQDAALTKRIAEQLKAQHPSMRYRAHRLTTLIGPSVAKHLPGSVDFLFDQARASVGDSSFAWHDNGTNELLRALAAVGRGRRDVVDWFVELTGSKDYGIAYAGIEGLGFLATAPEVSVPRLTAILRSHTPASDCEDVHDVCDAICMSLMAFGPAATPAVPYLLMHLHPFDDDELSDAVLEALAAIGPQASAALPALRVAAASNPQFDPADVEYDTLARAIAAVTDEETSI